MWWMIWLGVGMVVFLGLGLLVYLMALGKRDWGSFEARVGFSR